MATFDDDPRLYLLMFLADESPVWLPSAMHRIRFISSCRIQKDCSYCSSNKFMTNKRLTNKFITNE